MVEFYPNDVYDKLELDGVLLYISAYCLGERARKALNARRPHTDLEIITSGLNKAMDIKLGILSGERIPLENYEDIAQEISLLKKSGYVLSSDNYKNIIVTLSVIDKVSSFFKEQSEDVYNVVNQEWDKSDYLKDLLKTIFKVFDDDFNVRPSSSERLSKIYKKIRDKERDIHRIFNKLLKDYRSQGYLSDTEESTRNGRRVFSIPAENKRKIKGVIHDESATGKTVFMEPDEVMEANNELYNLESDKRAEILKILKDLTVEVAQHVYDIEVDFKRLVDLDQTNAIAIYAVNKGCSKPTLREEPCYQVEKATHPYLQVKNDKIGEKTVPFSIHLKGNNAMLVISGPNAGGKSVTLKAMGLLQIMVQCGIPIPVDERTEMGIFEKIFVDIGDQQSLEEDLSTYSSRLKNMKHFLDNSDEKTLLLIDEFGSGTDPQAGGALAEAGLSKLLEKKCFAIITTHYSNIKYFANKTKGIVNGYMSFDKKELRPTYELSLGKPGSSFAFEIAERSGIHQNVLKLARKLFGKKETEVESLLEKLQSENTRLTKRIASIEKKEKDLDRMTKMYDQLQTELEVRRKKMKIEMKQRALVEYDEKNRELQKLIKELREKENLKTVKELSNEIREKKLMVKDDIHNLDKSVYAMEKMDLEKIEVGGYARLRSGDQIGKVLSIRKNRVELVVGSLVMTVKLTELVPAAEPIEKNGHKHVTTTLTSHVGNFDTKLDIRGYSKKDAGPFIQEFIDQALINNSVSLTIVHGIGSGVLKREVMKKLKEYADIKKIYHPKEEYGGEGVTHITLG